jgi:glycosyltransferase involved in cell wall biosynthesis
MADADLGVVPKRDEGFGGEAFSTKILEFMALGVPLVVAETRIDRYYFNETQLKFFRPGDVTDLAQAILEVYEDSSASIDRADAALVSANAASWAERKGEYLGLVDRLVTGGS